MIIISILDGETEYSYVFMKPDEEYLISDLPASSIDFIICFKAITRFAQLQAMWYSYFFFSEGYAASPWVHKKLQNPADNAIGCFSRPCNKFQICVPNHTSKGFYCLNANVVKRKHCHRPKSVENADVTVHGYQIGDVAVVSCHVEYAAFPRDTIMELTCQVKY